jgi:ribosomal protein S12 methylthiotransferase
MLMQQRISLQKNRAFIGQTLDVLIEGVGELVTSKSSRAMREAEHHCGDCISIGRSYRDAPEVDGIVIVQNELPIGKFARVKITQASEYDLIGEPVSIE